MMVGGLSGFGISQVAVVAEVKGQAIEIGHLQRADDEIRAQAKIDRESYDKRMEMVIRLVESLLATQRESVASTRELITLIKLQNGIKP